MNSSEPKRYVSHVDRVVDILGGLTKVGEICGLKPSTVSGWKARNKIPQEYFDVLIKAAGLKGIKLGYADMMKLPEDNAA